MIRVLDTTAVSAVMREEPDIVDLLRAGRPGEFAVVPPVVAEIEYGIVRLPSGRKRNLLESQKDRYLPLLRLLPWCEVASVRFGEIKAHLEARGALIDDFDIAIAAIALAHGAAVLTANLPHFSRIPGLTCLNWSGP